MKRMFFVALLLLISYTFGATIRVDSDFRTNAEGVPAHFATDLNFNIGMSCTYSGKILSGTPCAGTATVCPGGTLAVTPSVTASWAKRYAGIVSSYPYCYSGATYCPSMIDYPMLNTNLNIRWLGDGIFDAYDVSDGDGHNSIPLRFGDEGIERYNELSTFHPQRVGYYNVTGGPIYTDKRGDANVFCNADVEVKRDGIVIDRQEIDRLRVANVPLPSEGTKRVSTRLVDTNCFAVVVKNPLDLDRPDYFNLILYGYNLPSIPVIEENTNIIVENRQPSLSNVPPRTVAQSSTVPSTYLISITAYNGGSVPVRVVSVHPVRGGSVSPASPYYCTLYGFPSTICPSDNGFGKTINVGERQRIYVIYTGELNGDVFNLEYEPLAPVCSDATKFNLTVNINLGDNTPASCRIAPSHLSLTPSEIHEWVVTCYNSADRVVPCIGDNWYFFDAYGGFIEKTNSRAKAYVRSVAGSSPMLVYQTDSVRCTSELSISPNEPESSNDPYSFVCELTPESVELNIGENQGFVLNCSLEGTPVSPTDVRYDLVNGLEGTLSDASTNGVTFTATTNSSGDIQVIAWYTAPGDPTLRGAIDWAHVVVGAGGNATINETGNETGERRGDVCELIPGSMEKYQHDAGYVGILCGEGEEKGPCSSSTDIVWNVNPDLYGRVVTSTTNGARFTIGSEGGTPTIGMHTNGVTAIIVDSDGTPLGQCWADINILESTCLDYS